jgi:glycosyltransferase involved in cell wall biosynthesis
VTTSRRVFALPEGLRYRRRASMRRRLRLLWVTPHVPRRGVMAARERWWALLARLATRHEVTLLAFVDDEDAGAAADLPPGLADVRRVPKRPWVPDDPLARLPRTVRGGYVHPALAAAVAETLRTAAPDLVQYEFTEMAALMPPATVPSILTVHQLGFAAHLPAWRAGQGGLGAGAAAVLRHLRDLDWELRAVRAAHQVVTMSPEDAARLRRFLPDLRVAVSPVGVDCADFRPPPTPPAGGPDLLFVGHFGHPPNVDAVRFLARDVLPRLGRPARLRVVGREMPPAIARLAGGQVEIRGPVPDVRPELAAAAVVVAPVRFGTGMRGKVLEALAMARPVVTTTIGAEGLGAASGRHLLVADGADAFAAAVAGCLDDPAAAARLGAAGRALVVERFDWDVIAAAHDDVYARVLRDPGRPPAPPPLPAPPPAALAALGGGVALAAGVGLAVARGLRWYARRRRGARPAPAVGAREAVSAR